MNYSVSTSPRYRGYCTLALLWASAIGCADPAPVTPPVVPLACSEPESSVYASFDDHTVGCVATVDAWFALSGSPVPTGADSQSGPVKFVIADFSGSEPAARFYDASFYALHDEWFMFRVYNGQPVPGSSQVTAFSGNFGDLTGIYAAFFGLAVEEMPPQLRWAGSRLTALGFYSEAGLGGGEEEATRAFALGTIVHYPANPKRQKPEALWGIQLEFADQPSEATLTAMFRLLDTQVPAELRDRLVWVTRSEPQRVIAKALRLSRSPLSPRVVLDDELLVDGEVEVYNPGFALGRARRFSGAPDPSGLTETDIAVVGLVPDDIPPVAALVSGQPQTALSHVNLLAKARGIPNAFVSGIIQDQQLTDLMRTSSVALKVDDDGVAWRAVTSEQVAAYRAAVGTAPPLISVDPPPFDSIPDFVDLERSSDASNDALWQQIEDLRPLVGGKSVGMLALTAIPGAVRPDSPMAITIAAEGRHSAEVRAKLATLANTYDFRFQRNLRFVILEGPQAFIAAHQGNHYALAWLENLKETHPATEANTNVVAWFLEQGGARQAVLNRPLDLAWRNAFYEALRQRFALLSPLQGLRFRSSSTAEDVPGFNGAGIYASHTGFIDAELQPRSKDRKRPAEDALRRTWGSYWTFAAWEERRRAGLDHFKGYMGVLVHPRFDDLREVANGVITFELSTHHSPALRRMVVNVQAGDVSVTNPGGTYALPEIDEVLLDGTTPRLQRIRPSTEVAPGEWLLGEETLAELALDVSGLADRWLAENRQQAIVADGPQGSPSTVVLDLEFKWMGPGWPAVASGHTLERGFVYKQVRVLDRPRQMGVIYEPADGSSVRLRVDDALPTDLKGAATRLTLVVCESSALTLQFHQAWTGAADSEALPFEDEGFVSRTAITFHQNLAPLVWQLERPYVFNWTVVPGRPQGDGYQWVLPSGLTDVVGLNMLRLRGQKLEVHHKQQAVDVDVSCHTTTLWRSPQAWVQEVFAQEPDPAD